MLVQGLKGRQLIYTFLSRVYAKEITREMLEELINESPMLHMGALQELEDEGYRNGFILLKNYLRNLNKDNLKDAQLQTAVDYANLFLGVGGKTWHPSESSYLDEDHLIMQEHRDEVFYDYLHSGVVKRSEFKEPEDHIAIELQFMAFICGKTIEVLERGDIQEAERYLQVQRDFLDTPCLSFGPTG